MVAIRVEQNRPHSGGAATGPARAGAPTAAGRWWWALFRKDLRILRAPLITGVLVTLGVYAVAAEDLWQAWEPEWDDAHRRANVAKEAVPFASAGVGMAALLAAACGGLALARERRDRSAEFLAMLPVPRRRIVISKLVACLACVLLAAGAHVAVVVAGARALAPMGDFMGRQAEVSLLGLPQAGAAAAAFFGVAWMWSSFTRSPAIAAVVALAAGMFGMLAIGLVCWDDAGRYVWNPTAVVWAMWGLHRTRWVPAAVLAGSQVTMIAAGAVAFIASTVAYVRRVEP